MWTLLGRLTDILRTQLGALSSTQLFYVASRRKVTVNKVTRENWSYHFGKYFHTLYLCSEVILSLMPQGKARIFPWLAVPPHNVAESLQTTIHTAFLQRHWQKDYVHMIVAWYSRDFLTYAILLLATWLHKTAVKPPFCHVLISRCIEKWFTAQLVYIRARSAAICERIWEKGSLRGQNRFRVSGTGTKHS